MLSKRCICKIKWKQWKEKTGNYTSKNKLLFKEKARIIKYLLRNLEEGNEPSIKSIYLMKKSSSGRQKENTLQLK